MKLHIGCGWPGGRYKQEEWINFDLVANKRVNVKGDMLDLPFKTNSIEEIHCVHVIEHLTRDKYPRALEEMHRVLKPGGKAYVEVPDFWGQIQILHSVFQRGDVGLIHNWTTSLFGKSENEGMSHHWAFYEGLLRKSMREAGFKDVVRLNEMDEMISNHYRHDLVLLVVGTK